MNNFDYDSGNGFDGGGGMDFGMDFGIVGAYTGGQGKYCIAICMQS